MIEVFIGIGSNVGDRATTVASAQKAIGELSQTALIGMSPVYETEPVGPIPQGRYLNAVAKLQTTLDPELLLAALEAIEHQTGRVAPAHRVKWGPRSLDLDILLCGDRIIRSGRLIVPHPRMHERWFVLRPLVDVDPNAYHPMLNATAAQLLAQVERKQMSAV